MNTTTVAVDLAKIVFQLAVADASWKGIQTHRLARSQFERWFANQEVGLVILEACGSEHHWARWLNGPDIEVKSLPAAYVQAYVRRNKTDAAAARCTDIEAMSRTLGDPNSAIPALIRGSMKLLVEEIFVLETRMASWSGSCPNWPATVRPALSCLLSMPWHWSVNHHFASWFRLTPREHSSGSTRTLGRISKRGDRDLRMLLTYAARSALRAASVTRQAGRSWFRDEPTTTRLPAPWLTN